MGLFSRFLRREITPGLDERVAELERQARVQAVEWEEWYDKYRRLYARIAKRAARDEQTDPESAQDAHRRPGTGTVGGNGHPPRTRSLRGF